MSRIGKQQLTLPANTEITISGDTVTVKGALATLSKNYDSKRVGIKLENDVVTFTPLLDDPETRALWGTYASHVKNMLQGVNAPYVKKLILEGVGFKSEVKGAELHLALGFSHPVVVKIPEDLKVTAEKNVVTISGSNKESVGQFAASVRALKKPEPYKGKGFRYENEVIRRKAGKKTA